jgi:hypothetical protein
MSSGNRTVKYENLLKSLRKHYKPLAEPPERSVLEHLLYACCLEDARIEQADEGFAKLQQTYFDWNEVRVTTVAELAEALNPCRFLCKLHRGSSSACNRSLKRGISTISTT